MTKDELIAKQQLELETLKQIIESNDELKKKIIGKFYNIGQPLNDNILNINNKQMAWCFQVVELAKQINN